MARRRRHFLQMLLIPVLGVAFLSARANALGEFQVFGGEVDYPVGGLPKGIVTDDFNGDGLLDLAVANGQDSVTVLYGFADGTFGNRADYPVGATPQFIAKGDFNRDGWVDLVVTNAGDNSVSVLYGQAGGGFGNRTDYAVGPTPLEIVTGDFNGDGRLDCAVLNGGSTWPPIWWRSDCVTVLYGQEGGGLGGKIEHTIGGSLRGMVSGDFNQDGKDDLAVGEGWGLFGRVIFLRGQAKGGLQRLEYSFPVSEGFVTGDFDKDGKLDLAGKFSLHDIGVIYGRTNGEFGGFKSYNVDRDFYISFGRGPILLTADLNADGNLDIVMDGAVVYGTSKGGFANQEAFGGDYDKPGIPMGPFLSGLAAGDFNHDGFLDLAATKSSEGSVAVIHALPYARKQYKVRAKPSFITTGDFSGDGRVDVAFTHLNANRVSVLYGQPDGGFDGRKDYAVGRRPTGIVAADLNRDGILDLAVAIHGKRDVSVLYGQPDGAFGGRRDYKLTKRQDVGIYGIAAGDFDSDGIVDLAVTTGNWDHGSVLILSGQAGDEFKETQRLAMPGAAFAVSAGDFGGDKAPELAVGYAEHWVIEDRPGHWKGQYRAKLNVLSQAGGIFYFFPTKAIHLSWEFWSVDFAAGDFDGDGIADVVLPEGVVYYYGPSEFPFLGPTSSRFNLSSFAKGVATGDFNRDGRLDIVLTNPSAKTITVFLNSGSK